MLKKYDHVEVTSEDELGHLFVINDLHSQTSLSSKVLVKATVLELLSGFAEFAVKEIVKQVEPEKPTERHGWQELENILHTTGVFLRYPETYAHQLHTH